MANPTCAEVITAPRGKPVQVTFSIPGYSLSLEFLEDDLFHFEFYPLGIRTGAIPTSPMIQHRQFAGPKKFIKNEWTIETATIRFELNPSNLCFSVFEKRVQKVVTTICPDNLQ